ncbi:acyltransferase, partial [Mesorhizobium sp. M00.F.Ca.ET.186.01.1.1]
FCHLYYIPLYLQLCLLLCLIKRWFEGFLRFRTLVVLFVGQIGLYGIYNYLFIHPLWEIDWAASPLLSFFQHTYVAGQNYVHMYIFTFALGAYAGLNLEKWRAWTWRLQVPACLVTLITALWIANDFVSGSRNTT